MSTRDRNALPAVSGFGNGTRFTGKERDQETGLDYFGARYFEAALGRFTSPDPANAGADPADPQTWNGYAYVRGNPMALTDPTGMWDIGGWDDGGGCDWFDPLCWPVSPCFFFDCVGGGTSGGGGSGDSGGTVSNTPKSTPMPPNSFPGGETLGLPPGMRVPLPSPAVLLGLGLNLDCEFGVCVGGVEGFGSDSARSGDASPSVERVDLVCSSVHTGVFWQDAVAGLLGLQHCWIRTRTKEAGMGPAKGGPLPNNPFGIPVAITDQSDHKGTSSKRIPNVSKSCVNSELQVGKSCGTWGSETTATRSHTECLPGAGRILGTRPGAHMGYRSTNHRDENSACIETNDNPMALVRGV